MATSAHHNQPGDDSAALPNSLPADAALPPVEPPSAGFIVQLFVVPALIVAAVIGVYLLFGKLASNDVDWRELVVDLRSGNAHTRWRGANGLAQLLEADSLRRSTTRTDGENAAPPITSDSELAVELANTLTQELARADQDADHQRLLEYLIKSLGWMDVPDATVPTLLKAFDQSSDPFLRQQVLIALGMIAGRAHAVGQPLDQPELTDVLLEVSQGEPDVLRHLATYDLGFLADSAAEARLQALVSDPDEKTRLNAAVGLARKQSPAALPVFTAILSAAATQSFDPQQVTTEAQANTYFERSQSLSNALAAAELMRDSLSSAQREEFLQLIEPFTRVADNELRHKAIATRHALQPAADPQP
jgi:hypothetical protein